MEGKVREIKERQIERKEIQPECRSWRQNEVGRKKAFSQLTFMKQPQGTLARKLRSLLEKNKYI
jgi:hypothetical protein